MYTMDDVRSTYKKRDAWWTVFLVDPIASRIMLPIANHTNITPNQITVIAFLLGILSAVCFFQGTPVFLIAGALLFHLSFTFDCIDGKLARLKGNGTMFGMWLDYMLDRARVALCSLALMTGQFLKTNEPLFIYLAFLIVFLDMTRYMNALHIFKIRSKMKKEVRKTLRQIYGETQQEQSEEQEESVGERNSRVVDLNQYFKSKFGFYLRVRDWLEKYRVRPHLFSGIEYQMFIFIIGPLVGLIEEMVIISSVLLLIFELAILYKLWLSTLDFKKEMEKLKHSLQNVT
ncbi:CDP-alcohol phosphatidyltransferase-like enzyme [Planifilum fimeticola]|uniref:CDP-alcohol phosphatidyltransferase-like enzyme n=1 Tax=Planifilum fimeticola TaxID=201975 RepID=A0A2T0LE26_9BACL|nr:CDP-alcohol phosphatidyltransferase family protein [Planifilum fimeticola]PRX40343.1 CDP-alcohol phosphatidyltransferase-like enzyme [Planifilum fimeticola]